MAARPRPTGLVIGVLALAGLCASVTASLVAPLLPLLPQITGASAEDASWLVTATVLSAAVATPISSRLADMYGKRRMVLVVLAVMAAGSLLGVVGASLPMLVASRALQGAAIALVPIGISIMRDELPRERLAAGVALMSATIGIGMAAGIPVSAFTYSHLGWDALFWGMAVLAVTMIAAVALVVPESPVRSGGRFDLLGAVVLSLALLGLLLGITKGGHWGWSSPPTVLSFGASLVLFAAWLPYEWRVSDALVDLRTTRQRPLLLVNAAGFITGFSLYSNTLSSSELLQLPAATGFGLGLPIATAGLMMMPPALMMVLVAPGSATISRRFGARTTLLVGSLFMLLGFTLRYWLMASAWQVVLGAVVVGVGGALTYGAMPLVIMAAVPVSETAAANGINSVMRNIGTATASATVAALFTTMTIQVEGESLPAQSAFLRLFALSAGAAVLLMVASLALPRRRGAGDTDFGPPAASRPVAASARSAPD